MEENTENELLTSYSGSANIRIILTNTKKSLTKRMPVPNPVILDRLIEDVYSNKNTTINSSVR